MSLWYEQIANVSTNVNELQFVNYGYANIDEHIDDNTGYYSRKLYEQVLGNVSLIDHDVLEVNCGRGAGAAWCVHTHSPRSFIGTDLSQCIIDLCQRLHSNIPQLSFVLTDATHHLPFSDQSTDVVICIETTHRFGGRTAVERFASEVARVLRPNGYFLWCDFCHTDRSDTSIDCFTVNDQLVVEEQMNITQNVLHALDIQSNSRTDFAERFILAEDQDYFGLFAGLPGTGIYEDMRQGCSEYWRAVLRKKAITNILSK